MKSIHTLSIATALILASLGGAIASDATDHHSVWVDIRLRGENR